MPTKSELEKRNKELTDEVRALRNEKKETEATIEGLDYEAHGIVINEDGFNLVQVKFDPESKKAAIGEIKTIGKSLAVAASTVKKAVIDHLVKVNKRG